MKIKFYKYQGAGNDFIMIDERTQEHHLTTEQIRRLCNRNFGIGADGLILLQNHHSSDFYMKYYNSDGNESTMCGNGGRCIVQFAYDLKHITEKTSFYAIDGLHHAEVFDDRVNLQMIDVQSINLENTDYILNTGSPHYVRFVENLKDCEVYQQGKNIRYSEQFPEGINVNFVEIISENHLAVRTYERGVENETLACGTGITACVLAYAFKNQLSEGNIKVEALGGNLAVSFKNNNNKFSEVWLKGGAEFVFSGIIKV